MTLCTCVEHVTSSWQECILNMCEHMICMKYGWQNSTVPSLYRKWRFFMLDACFCLLNLFGQNMFCWLVCFLQTNSQDSKCLQLTLKHLDWDFHLCWFTAAFYLIHFSVLATWYMADFNCDISSGISCGKSETVMEAFQSKPGVIYGVSADPRRWRNTTHIQWHWLLSHPAHCWHVKDIHTLD